MTDTEKVNMALDLLREVEQSSDLRLVRLAAAMLDATINVQVPPPVKLTGTTPMQA
jgi:hypothetical protein